MPTDLSWTCIQTEPDAYLEPHSLAKFDGESIPASVPGTAAGAVRTARGMDAALGIDYDASDWWFVTSFEADGPTRFRFDGLATVADVWIDHDKILHSESMFVGHIVDTDLAAGEHHLRIRFAALEPLLKVKRPRPRWRSTLVPARGLRWWRTTALGRMPGWAGFAAPVGPWRAVSVEALIPLSVDSSHISAYVDGDVGLVEIDLHLNGEVPGSALLRVGEVEYSVDPELVDGRSEIGATVRIENPQLWWPHTHGAQPLYPVSLIVDDQVIELGRVGFRTVTADRSSNGFALSINGDLVFARGACWVPLDVLALNAGREKMREAIQQVVDAGMNMIRVPGTMVYEDADFWDYCDELGVLVWQDAMLTTYDPPSDPEWLDEFKLELTQVLTPLAHRPSIAVVSGGSETEQQPTMLGLDDFEMPAIETVAPDVVESVLPGVPYVTSTPSGGDIATHNGSGIAHYFGVGGYLRPLTDARLAGVRFAAECLAFSIPPEADTVEEFFGGPAAAGQRPDWKQAVPRDAGSSWDFEDVRDFYTHEIFEVEPTLVRYSEPARALDLGRAAVANVIAATFAEWRRPGSPCDGALVLSLRDLIPGAGWGLVDSLGRIKAPMFALRNVLAPIAVTVTNEGLDGLALHVCNDPNEPIDTNLAVEVFDRAGNLVLEATQRVHVEGRGSLTISLDSVLGRFRDVSYAYRFGPQVYDALRVTLGAGLATQTYLIDAPWRAEQGDPGLSATARPKGDGQWEITVTSEQLAEWVALDVPGTQLSDSWFHLCPGETRSLVATGDIPRFAGTVRALNAVTEQPIVLE